MFKRLDKVRRFTQLTFLVDLQYMVLRRSLTDFKRLTREVKF